VTPAYFTVMGISLERGQLFSPPDQQNADAVAIINSAAARRYFANEDPVGRRVRFFGNLRPDNPWLRIVGVVSNEKRHSPFQEMAWVDAPIIYRAFDQDPPGAASLLIRLRGGAVRAGMIQRELAGIDPGVVVGEIETAQHLLDRYLAYPQFRAGLLGVFAAAAFLLAVVGLYGVLSQLVGQRVREIGIRMALGATARDVLTLVMSEGIWLTAFGIAGGLVGALCVSTVLANVLFGVTPHDPLTLSVVSAALFTTSLLASAVPALRAASTNPVVAMRED
jgi:putative ABC transport system permease protein